MAGVAGARSAGLRELAGDHRAAYAVAGERPAVPFGGFADADGESHSARVSLRDGFRVLPASLRRASRRIARARFCTGLIPMTALLLEETGKTPAEKMRFPVETRRFCPAPMRRGTQELFAGGFPMWRGAQETCLAGSLLRRDGGGFFSSGSPLRRTGQEFVACGFPSGRSGQEFFERRLPLRQGGGELFASGSAVRQGAPEKFLTGSPMRKPGAELFLTGSPDRSRRMDLRCRGWRSKHPGISRKRTQGSQGRLSFSFALYVFLCGYGAEMKDQPHGAV